MMKTVKVTLILIIAIGAVAVLIFAYFQMSKEREKEAEREKPVTAKSRVKLGPNGEAVLTVDQETQKRIALQVKLVVPAKMSPELKGYGRVLDAAPLAALSAELASAQAALAASQKEFDRLKLLNEQKNASDKALQAAEAAARRDQIAVESVRVRLAIGWGQAIAERADLAAFVQSLASSQSAVVRISLPAGEVLNAPFSSGRIVLASSEDKAVPAQLLGPAPTVDPQMQGPGFLFLVKAGSGRLVPGTAVTGYLQLTQGPLNGFIIPDSAVVRESGHGWVYVQTSGDNFTRRKIALDHPTENGWFVTNGITAGNRVVVGGGQTLLSEEQKYQIKLLE